jgi:hypothetical protein
MQDLMVEIRQRLELGFAVVERGRGRCRCRVRTGGRATRPPWGCRQHRRRQAAATWPLGAAWTQSRLWKTLVVMGEQYEVVTSLLGRGGLRLGELPRSEP